MFCSNPGLWPLDARAPPHQVETTKNSPDLAKCPLGAKLPHWELAYSHISYTSISHQEAFSHCYKSAAAALRWSRNFPCVTCGMDKVLPWFPPKTDKAVTLSSHRNDQKGNLWKREQKENAQVRWKIIKGEVEGKNPKKTEEREMERRKRSAERRDFSIPVSVGQSDPLYDKVAYFQRA